MLADKIVALRPGGLPAATVLKCEDLLIDVVGLYLDPPERAAVFAADHL